MQTNSSHFSPWMHISRVIYSAKRRKLLHSYDCLIILRFSSIYLFSLSNLITWESIKTLTKEIRVSFEELDGLLIKVK